MTAVMPANIAEKLRSGTLTEEERRYRLDFWSKRGCDVSEWACNTSCVHHSRGCCRLAATLAKAPVDHAKLNAECVSCQAQTKEPEIGNVPAAVLDLSKLTEQRYRGQTKPTATPPEKPKKAEPGMDEPTAFKKYACIHRTPTDKKHKCVHCGGGGRVHTVCECSLLHRQCTVLTAGDCKDDRDRARVEFCFSCDHREAPVVPKMDYLTTIQGKPADLSGLYQGATCVLLCGGPSLAGMDLATIQQRGIAIAAINNAAAAVGVRPHMMFCMDQMKKFHPAILLDPGITCFINQDKLDNRLRLVGGSDNLGGARACPNVFVYRVKDGDRLDAANFMGGPLSYRFTKQDGNAKSATMPVALRILLDLGFQRIGIVGADFHMGPDQQYAWDEPKDKKAQGSNNRLYAEMNALFEAAAPGIAKQGRLVVNCTAGGNLTAFPRMALAEFCRMGLEKFPAFVSAKGYYVDGPR